MRITPVVMLAVTLSTPAAAATPDWSKVDQTLGRSGAALAGDVHRYGFHVGCETAETLRKAGFDARYMAGGRYAWKATKGAVKLFE